MYFDELSFMSITKIMKDALNFNGLPQFATNARTYAFSTRVCVQVGTMAMPDDLEPYISRTLDRLAVIRPIFEGMKAHALARVLPALLCLDSVQMISYPCSFLLKLRIGRLSILECLEST